MKKKVLIITYYWPPAGGPGVQRWLKFVKYLPDFDIEPIVFIPENPNYPIIDSELQKDINPNTIIIKNPISEPYKLASIFSKKTTNAISSGIIPNKKKQSFLDKFLLYVRGNFFIPDARIGWVKPSVSVLDNYIKEYPVDLIITTGPPHSLHLIGLELKNKLNCKWFADFRDPWTSIGYHKQLKLTERSKEKHLKLEKEVLNTADHILVTSPTTKNEFTKLTHKPITVITNGYDVEYIQKKPLDSKFSIAHIGSFLSERNPRIFWKALSELIKENKDFKEDFELKLIGKVSQEILDVVSEFKLSNYLNNLGYLSHNQALIEQRSSQVLLLVEIDSEETVGIIPGKLFEYMAAERPILAIGPEGADFSNIIKETNSGTFFTYDQKDEIKEQIIKLYDLYKQNELKVYAMGLQYYSRKKLTEKLANIIKNEA
ncbi:glycosyltransferase [Paenimyroides tangerinum]|uniref:Glycosyltransferase n=1 Tax=Paenimyroides tangerinum TaxID=2488728 RepID=A0A3P3WB89_9FLAO|nr:glycosyltransferase family 4 protein [Paenimyroides tangerinum]RRJ91276.1 glycosyltransferase [Paenimyroides tangerinum]